MIYKIKNAPKEVKKWFNNHYPISKGFFHHFYWYRGREGNKIYGCLVMKNKHLYHNATQASENWYKKENKQATLEKYICKKCGLVRMKGTRELERDFIFSDVCIKCNKK